MGFYESDDEKNYTSLAVGKNENKQVDCQDYERIRSRKGSRRFRSGISP
jgi:hypothetical protein